MKDFDKKTQLHVDKVNVSSKKHIHKIQTVCFNDTISRKYL